MGVEYTVLEVRKEVCAEIVSFQMVEDLCTDEFACREY